MRKQFKRKIGKRGPVRAKKVSYDGIDFASGLEKHMRTKFMKDKLMVKESIRIEDANAYYLLSTLLILLAKIS
jgi:hypothetical protein